MTRCCLNKTIYQESHNLTAATLDIKYYIILLKYKFNEQCADYSDAMCAAVTYICQSDAKCNESSRKNIMFHFTMPNNRLCWRYLILSVRISWLTRCTSSGRCFYN